MLTYSAEQPLRLASTQDRPHCFTSVWMSAFEKEQRRQEAVDQSGALALQGHPELQRVVELASAHYGTAFAAVSIIHKRAQILLAQHGMDSNGTPRNTAICAVTIQKPGEPLIVPDTHADPRFAGYATVVSEPFLRFYAGVPVLDEAGYALGALCVADNKPRVAPFDPTLLTILAREAERHIQR
ncbi:GAF domain-containing protein [Sphingomonas desiccabilis]|uniref:GAF domain-containing protein n=1 Tax=Sphingomonas desiccabilis TaxID=429134 RepID=A0A4Q2IZA2_9SPHN|nr:GAF domain-containing protein [Sphingomonas desiccabilis]MBB3912722.1 GAF domain-containing protein [Sphingomonas desiccabilis]RXZ34683.1 GAF domain-containing protein [Sphingomonas desiccabilis]